MTTQEINVGDIITLGRAKTQYRILQIDARIKGPSALLLETLDPEGYAVTWASARQVKVVEKADDVVDPDQTEDLAPFTITYNPHDARKDERIKVVVQAPADSDVEAIEALWRATVTPDDTIVSIERGDTAAE